MDDDRPCFSFKSSILGHSCFKNLPKIAVSARASQAFSGCFRYNVLKVFLDVLPLRFFEKLLKSKYVLFP